MFKLFFATVAASTGVWGNPGDWVVANVVTGETEHLELFDNERASDVSVSRDGTRFVLRAERDGLIYTWTRGAKLRQIGPSQGFIEGPTISADGATIYFAHSPNGMAPGSHVPQQWAQIWSINWDGTNAKQLTSSTGCHSSPTIGPSNQLTFIHADCQGSFGGGTIGQNGKESSFRKADGLIRDTFALKGHVFSIVDKAQTRRIARSGPSTTSQLIVDTGLPSEAQRARPITTPSESEICFQSVSQVVCVDLKSKAQRTLATFKWRPL